MSTNQAQTGYQEPELNLDGLTAGSGGFGNFTNHKITDGDNIFRILPPFGTNHNGLPMAEWYLHWGFTDDQGNKKVLVCTKRFEKFCPICQQANTLRDTMSEIVREFEYEADGRTKVAWKNVPKELAVKHNEVKEQFDAIRAQRGYYYNALDESGTVGVLKIPKTAKDGLNEKIKDAVKRLGFNPLSLRDGCAFNIKRVRTGPNNFDVEYKVELVKVAVKDAAGDIVEKTPRSSVSEDLIQNFSERAYDIHTLYTVRPSSDLAKIMQGDTSVFAAEAAAKKTVQAERTASTAAAATAETIAPTTTEAPVTVEKPTVVMEGNTVTDTPKVATEVTTVTTPEAVQAKVETPTTETPTVAQTPDTTDPAVAALAKKLGHL